MPWVAKGAVKNVAIVISDQEGTPLEKFYFELELRLGLGGTSDGGGAEASSAVEDSRRHALRALMLKLNISDSYGAKFIRHARVQKSFDRPIPAPTIFAGRTQPITPIAMAFVGSNAKGHPHRGTLAKLLPMQRLRHRQGERLGSTKQVTLAFCKCITHLNLLPAY
jgi:hypothetical protein